MQTVALRSAVWVTGVAMAVVLGSCTSGDDSIRYDPEQYREHIEKIEALVQKDEVGPRDGSTLAKYSTDLAGAMGKNIENHRVRETIMNRLIMFGQTYADMETSDIPFEMAEVREEWAAVRTDLFQPANWFK